MQNFYNKLGKEIASHLKINKHKPEIKALHQLKKTPGI